MKGARMATVRELLEEHNQLCDLTEGHEPISSWSRKKALLETRVAELRRSVLGAQRGEKITIQLIAEEALLEIAEEDFNGNKLGYPYAMILERVYELFPDARTTARTLAWYASKMRGAGIRVPFRPRAKNGTS